MAFPALNKKTKWTKNNTYCCVPQCNTKGTNNPEASFHHFPCLNNASEVKRRKKWILALRIGKEVSKRMVVCSKHFKLTDYILPNVITSRPSLKRTAVPSLCLPVNPVGSGSRVLEEITEEHNVEKSISRKNPQVVHFDEWMQMEAEKHIKVNQTSGSKTFYYIPLNTLQLSLPSCAWKQK